MKKYTISISQFYEFRDTIEVEAEGVSAAQAMALEQFCCDWDNAIHHADQTTIAFLDAEEPEAREEVQALEARCPAGTSGPGNTPPLTGETEQQPGRVRCPAFSEDSTIHPNSHHLARLQHSFPLFDMLLRY